MSEQEGADEALIDEDAREASEVAPAATAVIERPVEQEGTGAEEAAPAAGAGEDPVADEPGAAAPGAEEPSAPPATGAVRTARVFVCECGYRTVAIWGDPQTCQAQRSRRGDICGKPLYGLEQVPEKVQKALNPLKASRKKAKGGD